MTIHTIGDSHACNGWTSVMQHHLGPLLCYSFGKENLNRCDIRNLNIIDGDTIIFCLGEIDCRCHIHKHITNSMTYQKIICNIVDKYIEAIKLNVSISQLKLKNVCVYNVVPPVQKHNTLENFEFPFLGNDEERKNYVLFFNKLLKVKCKENDYVFIDIYDSCVDEKGFLRKDISDGNVHVINKTYTSNFIKDHNL
jgi:hypothetical protein